MALSGSDIIIGTASSEHLNGGASADTILAADGADTINAGSGDDVVDGGSGSDIVKGDSGNDLLIYNASENVGATDIYDGGSGFDTLRLMLTRAEWLSASIQSDVANYLLFIAANTNPVNGQATNTEFQFSSFDLRISKIERLEIVVDGLVLDPRDEAVTLQNDLVATDEDNTSTAINLLANDSIPDLVQSVVVLQGPTRGSHQLNVDLADVANPKALLTYTPGAALQSLGVGESTTDKIVYQVTDADGDVQTASVTITITGTNDGPIAIADTNAGDPVVEAGVNPGNMPFVGDSSASGNVLANDTDVDNGDTKAVIGVQAGVNGGHIAGNVGTSIAGTYGALTLAADGSWNYTLDDADPNTNALAQWESASDVFSYTIADAAGATSSTTLTINIDGTNDAPVAAPDTNASDAVVEAGIVTSFANVNLADVAAGTGGFKIIGENAFDLNGISVSGVGDVNGDGRPDVLVGALRNDSDVADTGAAYVVFGADIPATVNLDDVAAGIGGFKIIGENVLDDFGFVARVGDMNGDGLADILVGSEENDGGGTQSGAVYVVFGKADGAAVNLDDVAAGLGGGFKIIGENAGDAAGRSVAGIGDVNGDGVPDILLGADQNFSFTQTGAAYVVFGKATATPIDLDQVAAGIGGFKIIAESAGDMAGSSVAGISDVNGDGRPDLLIAARSNDAGGNFSGAAYVVFGKDSGTPVNLVDVAAGIGGFKIIGESEFDSVGVSVAGVGDVNGDGRPDLLIGATGNDAGGLDASRFSSGAAYLVFGKANGTAVDLDDVAAGIGGFKIIGENGGDVLGSSVAGLGDVNGDGRPDLLIGAQLNDGGGSNSGAAYVVFGKADGTAVNLDNVAVGIGGFKISGEAANDFAAGAVAGLDDLNGDGQPDLMIAGIGNDAGGNGSGAAYVLFTGADAHAAGNVLANDTDVDAGDTNTVVGVAAGPASGPLSGGVGTSITGTYGTLALAADGSWNYTLDNADPNTNALAQGESAADVFSYTIVDAAGATSSTTLTINIDGTNDAPVATPDTNAGDPVVEAGTLTSFANVNLDEVATGIGGFKIIGENAGDFAGFSVAAGDVNGDSRPDILVAAFQNAAGGRGTGAAYVVFGSETSTTVNLDDVAAGIGGFKIIGEHDFDGVRSVAAIGDLNGDGLTDIMIGAPGNDAGGNGSGAAWLVFGRTDGAPVNLDDVALGIGGFKLIGEDAFDQAGWTVAAADDVNGDGRADLLIGALGNDGKGAGSNTGAAYVVFGSEMNDTIDLGAVGSGVGGFKIIGEVAGDEAGESVAGVGDVNGDGLADLLLGGTWNDEGGTDAGAAYVVFGKADNTAVDLADVVNGVGGFKIVGESALDLTGDLVSAAGDVNGDGLNDVLISALGNDAGGNGSGAAFVVFGKADGAAVNLDDVSLGIGGFKIIGENAFDTASFGIGRADDVNGDGFDDLLIGAIGNDADGLNSGAAYVVFGKASGTAVNLDDVAAGLGGYKIIGETAGDTTGLSIASADVNGDGSLDILVSAHGNDAGGSNSGAAYVVFGPPIGDAHAAGNVLANDSDVDASDVLTVSTAGTFLGIYGTLTLAANGDWTYTLDNADRETNALPQGEAASDAFSYTVSDGHGGTATSMLTVNITGTNDAPVITGGTTTGAAQEDVSSQAAGQLIVLDPDHNASHSWTVVGSDGAANADYLFRADTFTVTRNGNLLFQDTFSDGVAPPTAPNFANGTPASYGGNGDFTEAGGKLLLDSDTATLRVGVGNPDPVIGQSAILRTNIDPASQNGLKSTANFSVAAVFDLILPDSPREGYGIRLQDRHIGGDGSPADQLGDDTIELSVRQNDNGTLVVRLRELDFVADAVTNIESIALDPPVGADQIRLRLDHSTSDVGAVHASFDFLAAGVVVGSHSFTEVGRIFGTETPAFAGDDENWTRAAVVASAPELSDTVLPGAYGSLNINQAGEWTYTLDNSRFATQNLAEGQTAADTFTVTVADEHGATDSETVTITVTGSNDTPVMETGAVSRSLLEDSATPNLTATGHAQFTDIDLTDAHTVSPVLQSSVLSGGGSLPPGLAALLDGALAASIIEPATGDAHGDIRWDFALANSAVQSLAAGQTLTVGYRLDVVDPFGGTTSQNVTIFIAGTNDAPVIHAATSLGEGVSTAEEMPVTISGVSVSDVDAGSNALLVSLSVADGALALTSNMGLVFTDPDGSDGTLAFEGSQAAINTALANSIVYTPRLNFNGSDTLTVTASDLPHNGAGDALLDSETFQITVDPVNDPPVIGGTSSGSVTEDTVTVVSGMLTISDPDAGESAFIAASGLAGAFGNLAIGSAGNWSYFLNNVHPSVQALSAGQQLFDMVNVRTVDGTIKPIDITIFGINDAGFAGKTVEYQYLFPTIFNNYPGDSAVPDTHHIFTVVEPAEFINDGFQDYSVDVDATTITVRYLTNAGWNPFVSFNGFRITDIGGTINPIIGVTDTTGKVTTTFDSNNVYVNWRGAFFSAGEQFTVFVTFGSGADPIILDLGEPGIGFVESDGVLFDLDANGTKESLAWTSGHDGMLVMDLDGSGAIESGREVFSPVFGEGGYADALDALAALDGNGDHVIDAHDAAFDGVLAWVDQNRDGVSQAGELATLMAAGIESIALNAENVDYQINGQQVDAEGQFTLATGETRDFLAVRLANSSTVPTGEEVQVRPNEGTNGTASANPLEGTASADTLIGTSVGDIIAGLGGNDILEGGAGDDIFVFAAEFGQDTVTDFTPAAEMLEFDSSLFADAAAVLAASADDGLGNTVIIYDAENRITLQRVLKASLDAGDFLFV